MISTFKYYIGKNGMIISGSKRTRERQRAWQKFSFKKNGDRQ